MHCKHRIHTICSRTRRHIHEDMNEDSEISTVIKLCFTESLCLTFLKVANINRFEPKQLFQWLIEPDSWNPNSSRGRVG
jgi:hypothetical protein